jgi:tetratricopeptide (TPR) repeat protein
VVTVSSSASLIAPLPVIGRGAPAPLRCRTDGVVQELPAPEALERAIQAYRNLLSDEVLTLGEDDPDTLTTCYSLADANRSVGRHTDAISLYERTLADRERVLGPDHPDILASRNGLALTYRLAGRLAEAILLYERTLAEFERVLGRTTRTL